MAMGMSYEQFWNGSPYLVQTYLKAFRYKRELENDYKIRRNAIDFNIPLLTNARLASAFINAFCSMTFDDIKIKAWDEY